MHRDKLFPAADKRYNRLEGGAPPGRAPPVSMDMIGKRGEALFSVAITAFCDGKFWFEDTFLGAKAEGLDFSVRLIDSSVFHANFYVQVKATAKAKRYSGKGKRRRILVTLEAAHATKLGAMKVPAYVVGIDIVSGRPTSRMSRRDPRRDSLAFPSGIGLIATPSRESGEKSRISGRSGRKE